VEVEWVSAKPGGSITPDNKSKGRDHVLSKESGRTVTLVLPPATVSVYFRTTDPCKVTYGIAQLQRVRRM